MKKLVLIGGKGGTGKSLLSLSLLDILLRMDKKPFYVETVEHIADVYKAVHDYIPCVYADVPDELSRIEAGLSSENPDCVIVNTSLKLADFILYAHIFKEFAESNHLSFTLAWTIDLHRDSLKMLRHVLSSGISGESVIVVKNLFFDSDFNRYNHTRISNAVSGSVIMPVLNKIIFEKLVYDRLPFWVDNKQFHIVERSILNRFRCDIEKNLKLILV